MPDLTIQGANKALVENFRGQKAEETGKDFRRMIGEAIERADSLDKQANRSVGELLKGNADIHETMIALQKADLSMRLLLAVRGKAIDAYREIMRIQF